MNWKLWGSTIIAALLGAILIILSIIIDAFPPNRYINLALLILGACSGWLLGTIISPYDRREKAEFSTYTKALTAFVSGYVVAKIDKVVDIIFSPDFLLQPLFGFRFIGFISAFILAMLITFFFRRYAQVTLKADASN